MELCEWLIVILLALHSSLIYAESTDDLLEFIPVSGANTDENVYLTDSSPEVLLDATSKITRSVYFLAETNLVSIDVRFSCQVALRSKPLTDVKLCCGGTTSGNSPNCRRLLSKPTTGQLTCNRILFGYTFDKMRGANFTLSFNPIRERNFPYNEQLYCEVEDSDATIQSNIVELRDAIFYKTQLGVEASNSVEELQPAVISPRDFPLKFSCGDYVEKIRDWPSWMAAVWQQYLSPFEWALCRVDESTTPAGCAKKRIPLALGDSVTTMDGTLFLLSSTVLANNPNAAFICLKRGSTYGPIRVFASRFQSETTTPRIIQGFTLDPEAPANQPGGFTALSPVDTAYEFTEGTVLSDFRLLAFYRVPEYAQGSVRTAWFKDGRRLTDPEATPTSFRLPNKVERSFAGLYELRVMEGGAQRLRFTFRINVVGAPTFRDVGCIEDLFYALEGASRRFTCLLNAREGDSVDFRVGINGFEAGSGEELRRMLASSLQLQNQPVVRLDVEFWRREERDAKGVVVEVKRLEQGQNFRLSVKAINAYGQSLVAGTLRVVPKPALQIAPSRQSCREECSETPFDVQCVPTQAVMDQWWSLNIIYQQGWVLARTFTMKKVMEDPEMAQFFIYNESKPHVLRVSPYIAFADLTSDLPPTESASTATSSSSSSSTATSASSTEEGTTPLYYVSTTTTPRNTLQEVLARRLATRPNELQLECRFQLYVNNSRAKFEAYSRTGGGSGTVTGGGGVSGGSGSGSSGSMKRLRRETTTPIVDEQWKMYDSYNEEDSTLKDTLTLTRTFSEGGAPAGANMAWIAAVVIAIIFILIVAIVGIWLCTRNRGETYKLSKKEYKLGNDPLRELKEKETFQAYERPEEPPSLASGMEEPDLEVMSDEDGELEAYNMDPARSRLVSASPQRTFNEEASFIGQYSSPARNSGSRDHHTAV